MNFLITSEITGWTDLTITMDGNLTVLSLKNTLSFMKKVPVNLITLRSNGLILNDTDLLNSVSLDGGSALSFSYTIPVIL